MNSDFLKDIWNRQEAEDRFSQAEIFKMLSRKSLNNVRIIVLVNGIEILFSVVLYIYGILNKQNILLKAQHNPEHDHHFEISFEFMYDVVYPVFLAVMILFFVLFILRYRKLHVQQTVKQFIERLIAFRKISYWYVGISIIVGLISMVYIFYKGIVISEAAIPLEKWGIIIGVMIVFGLIFLLLIGVYYYILYGIVLRKINKNLKTLKEIENEKI